MSDNNNGYSQMKAIVIGDVPWGEKKTAPTDPPEPDHYVQMLHILIHQYRAACQHYYALNDYEKNQYYEGKLAATEDALRHYRELKL